MWCFGYHDGDKGYFPASAITLNLPAKDDVPTNPRSTLWATAKWDHKPKEAHGEWLIFKRGDKITNIGFTSQDAWCWSGYHKGKWGLFPACFAEGLKEDVTLGQEIPTPGRHGSGDGSPRGHTGIGSFIKRRTAANNTTPG
jgi:Variant SH3 domain